MQRMAWDNKMDQQRTHKKDMLDGMHRESRPWPGIDITMMNGMKKLIEKWNVQDPVPPIEMKALPYLQ